MKTNILGLTLTALWVALPALADDAAPGKGAEPDYTQLSQMIKKAMIAQLPKVYEDEAGWGRTVPLTEKLPLMGLRKVVEVGGKPEVPQGTWRKTKVWVTNPERDVDVQVKSLKQLDASTYRLKLDGGIVVRSETALQQWAKGLRLIDLVAKADADVGVSLEADVKLSLDPSQFPPAVKVEPKVTNLKVQLHDFHLKEVDWKRFGKVLQGEKAREVSDQLKGVLQDAITAAEPMIKEEANKAIAKSLQEGKGTFSAGALFKAAPKDGK